jgi:hypothetical protein
MRCALELEWIQKRQIESKRATLVHAEKTPPVRRFVYAAQRITRSLRSDPGCRAFRSAAKQSGSKKYQCE